MTEKLEIYKCNICGNIAQILINSNGELVCCGEKMELLIPKTDEKNELSEKHVPIIEKIDDKVCVKILNHPMQEEHYIQFIEVVSKDNSSIHLKYFKPNENPEFDVTYIEQDFKALELCNIHGLWENKND